VSRSALPRSRAEDVTYDRPVTDPAASKPMPQYVHDILTDKPTAYLATLRPDGRMSVTPMGLLFDGRYLLLSTTKDRKKYRNLLADDRVTVCVPHRNNPNRYVEVRGRAELIDDVDRSFINSVAQAYMDVPVYPFDRPGQERVTIRVIAEHVSAPRIPLADDPPNAPD
jgi:PPOX class probable F420-dependent enzyme